MNYMQMVEIGWIDLVLVHTHTIVICTFFVLIITFSSPYHTFNTC